MVEDVPTGGLMRFTHSYETPKLREDQKKAIEDAYKQSHERKIKERKKKRIFIILVLIILFIIGLTYFLLFNK